MKNIDLLKQSVNGVEGSFLIRDGEVMECDFEEEKVHFLSKSISFFVESFHGLDKSLKKMSMAGERYCLIFFYDRYILGIVASRETNLPLLELVSNKLLHTIELSIEESKEAIDDAIERMEAFIR